MIFELINFVHYIQQVAECQLEGRECILVSSGAVTFGKQKLTEEYMKSLSMRETLSPDNKREVNPVIRNLHSAFRVEKHFEK